MIDLSLILLLLGLIIFIGVFGNILSRKTKIPESFYLLIFGVIIGPLTGTVSGTEMLELAPSFSILALIIILIDAGINFDILQILRTLPAAILFTLTVMIVTTLIVAGMLHYVFGWEMLYALFLGLISSGNTTITAISLLAHVKGISHIRRLITLETIINDLTIIIGAVILVNIMTLQSISDVHPLSEAVSKISVGLLIGFLAAIGWKEVIQDAIPVGFRYFSTLGAAFVIYYIVEQVGGSPIIGIFAFAVVLGNVTRIFKMNKKSRESFRSILQNIRDAQGGLSLVTKSFFFVMLGILFSFNALTETVLLIVLGIVAAAFISRYLSATIVSFYDAKLKKHKALIAGMLPRGFVATVAAFLPLEAGIEIPNITDIMLLLVFATTIVAMITVMLFSREEEEK